MTRLNREDWLAQGLNIVAETGVDALTIEVMCQKMAVTKGSFYHHFKNRQDFLEGVLRYWEATYTQQFIAHSQAGLTPQQQLALLMERVVESYGPYEVHIRAWAQRDPLARTVQERVDQQRIAYLIAVQQDLYRDPADARTMAHLQYTALIGSAQIMPPLSAADLQAMYQLLARLSAALLEKDNP